MMVARNAAVRWAVLLAILGTLAIARGPSSFADSSGPLGITNTAAGQPPTLTWRASQIWGGEFDGPVDAANHEWWASSFDDASWSLVQLPDVDSIPEGSDRFYRASVDVSDPSSFGAVSFSSDDGLWLYVNGTMVGHWGAAWHQAGCVNNPESICGSSTTVAPISLSPYLQAGQNVIAVRVSNGGCCRSYFVFGTSTQLTEAFAPVLWLANGDYEPEEVQIMLDEPSRHNKTTVLKRHVSGRSADEDEELATYPSVQMLSDYSSSNNYVDILGVHPGNEDGYRNLYQGLMDEYHPVTYAEVLDLPNGRIAIDYWFFYFYDEFYVVSSLSPISPQASQHSSRITNRAQLLAQHGGAVM